MNTALVVAAHPDDEVLGCGGTIARMIDEGWSVHVLILAEGATSRDDARDRASRSDELSELSRCAREAGRIMGATSVTLEDFPDNRMDSIDLLDIVKVIETHMARHQPSRVLTHSNTDVNVDHRMIHDAAIAACRSKPGVALRELWFFEVLSSTEWRPPASLPPFAPVLYVDISGTLQRKIDAMAAYAPELLDFPHPRSLAAVEHLARYRGSTVGRHAAEAFEVGRILL